MKGRFICHRRSTLNVYWSTSIHKPVSTPLACYMMLSKKMCPTTREEEENIAKVPYSYVVRSLMYTMVCTTPDIAQAVGVVSKFLENPGKEHWEDVK